jgi:hypothetical protein
VPIYLNIVPGEYPNFVSVLALEPVCVQGPEYKNDVSLGESEFPVGQCLEVVERTRTERSLCVVPAERGAGRRPPVQVVQVRIRVTVRVVAIQGNRRLLTWPTLHHHN